MFQVWDPSYSGAYSLSITRKPGKVKKLSVRKKGKRKVLVKWKKQSGASGYLLYRATSKHGYYKLIKKIKGEPALRQWKQSCADCGNRCRYIYGQTH